MHSHAQTHASTDVFFDNLRRRWDVNDSVSLVHIDLRHEESDAELSCSDVPRTLHAREQSGHFPSCLNKC